MSANRFVDAFRKISKDERANLSHVNLYISLLAHWHEQAYQNPLSASRKQLMSATRIKSKVTYHKCIKELHEFGYINYAPSYNPFTASSITIIADSGETSENKASIRKKILIRLSIEAEQL